MPFLYTDLIEILSISDIKNLRPVLACIVNLIVLNFTIISNFSYC